MKAYNYGCLLIYYHQSLSLFRKWVHGTVVHMTKYNENIICEHFTEIINVENWDTSTLQNKISYYIPSLLNAENSNNHIPEEQ